MREKQLARQIVRKLLVEKLTFAPETNADGRNGFRFSGPGTLAPLVESSLKQVVPPTGRIFELFAPWVEAVSGLQVALAAA